MLTKICIFEQKGDVSGVYYVLPLIDPTKDPEYEKKNEKAILEALRYDHEERLHGHRVPKNNPSCDPAAIKFYGIGTPYRQKLYRSTFPVVLPDRVLIDVFTCLGSRFGLEQRNIFVEVYKTPNRDYYAHLMYVVSPECIASIISMRQWAVFFKDEHMHGM